MTTFYISVLFYYKFNEHISATKIAGMLLMIPCILLLVVGGVPADEGDILSGAESESYTMSEQQLYAVLSVSFAMIAPFFWTAKCLYLRLSEDRYNFNLFDLAIDGQIY